MKECSFLVQPKQLFPGCLFRLSFYREVINLSGPTKELGDQNHIYKQLVYIYKILWFDLILLSILNIYYFSTIYVTENSMKVEL